MTTPENEKYLQRVNKSIKAEQAHALEQRKQREVDRLELEEQRLQFEERLQRIRQGTQKYGDYWVTRFGSRAMKIVRQVKLGEAVTDKRLSVRLYDNETRGFVDRGFATLVLTLSQEDTAFHETRPTKYYQTRVYCAEFIAWPIFSLIKSTWGATEMSDPDQNSVSEPTTNAS